MTLRVGATRVRGAVKQLGSVAISVETGNPIGVQKGAALALEWAAEEGLAKMACEVVTTRLTRVVLTQIGLPQLIQRRESPRVEIELHVAAEHPRGRARGLTIDVSEGGLLAHLPDLRASEGDKVELLLELPGREIAAGARVVRAAEDGRVAFMFTELNLGARERLVRLVAERQGDVRDDAAA